jgi:hypothetical protein
LALEWPWPDLPSTADYSLGLSVSYRDWRLKNGYEASIKVPASLPAAKSSQQDASPGVLRDTAASSSMASGSQDSRVMEVAAALLSLKGGYKSWADEHAEMEEESKEEQ